MDLPGLGQKPAAPEGGEEKPTTTYDLAAGSEWRFEVSYGSSIEVKLLRGTAELFGTELAPNQPYTFTGTKAAIFTWQNDCQIALTGTPASDYVAEETPMSSYANLHFGLERLRDAAASAGRVGPRVMLVGPEDSGKTAVAKILAAYATRSGRRPLVTNLNPGEGLLSVPGTLSAVAFESILDVEEGWGSSPLTGPSPVPVKLPLVYFYGATDSLAAPERLKPALTRLALAVRHHGDEDREARSTGCIVDTPGAWASGVAAKGGYELIRAATTELGIDVLAVLGSERLYSALTKAVGSSATVLRLDKSEGCVERDADERRALQAAQMRAYFYGRGGPASVAPPLAPHTLSIPFSELTIYRPKEADDIVPAGLMPGGIDDSIGGGGGSMGMGGAGASSSSNSLLERVSAPFPPDLQGGLLAVLHADANVRVDAVCEAPVLGFLYVLDVELDRARLKVLSPMGGRVPRNALLWGRGVEVGSEIMS